MPNENSGLCERHLLPSDCTTERFNDSNKRRKKILGELKKKPRLKPDAIPTSFPNCPSYLTAMKPKERSEKATPSIREKLEQKRQSFTLKK